MEKNAILTRTNLLLFSYGFACLIIFKETIYFFLSSIQLLLVFDDRDGINEREKTHNENLHSLQNLTVDDLAMMKPN